MTVHGTGRPGPRAPRLLARSCAMVLLTSAWLTLTWSSAPTAAHALATCAGAHVEGPWIALPTPAELANPVQHLAVGGVLEEVVVAADDTVVVRSDDGGCTWREVYRVPVPADTSGVGNYRPQVKDLALVVDGDHDVVLVSTMAGPAVTVVRSEDGAPFQPVVPGAFIASTTGTAPCNANEGCQIVVSEADSSRIYLHAGGSLEGGGILWRSDDHGRTFDLLHTALVDGFLLDDPGGLHLDGVQQLRTDPNDPDALVALYNCDHLARSSDGGTTWDVVTRPGTPTDPFMGLAARRPGPTGPQRLVAVEMNQYCTGSSMKTLHRSLDGGETWQSKLFGGPDLHAVELDSSGEVAVVVDETGVVSSFNVSSLATTRLSTPNGTTAIDPQVLDAPGSFAMAAPEAILVLQLDVEPSIDDGLFEDLRPELPPLRRCTEPPMQPSRTEPSSLDVEDSISLGVGEQVDLPVQGHSGAAPVPVDVAFLLDDSGSMAGAQESLARSIGAAAGRLRDSDVDLHVGLGRFADLVNLPYQRMLDVSPVDCRLDQRLAQLGAGGSVEPHLLALEQLITGAGFPAVGLPRGEQMRFRDGATALVVHATDEGVTESPPPYPSHEQVGAAYRRAGVTHLGLSVGGTNLAGAEDDLPADPDAVRADLARISTETGSLAPVPIDCNGDGLPDIGAGDPLVCGFDATLTAAEGLLATEVGSIVAQVVDGLVGPVDVTLTVERAPARARVRVTGSRTFDPRKGGEVPGTLSLRCLAPTDGTLRLGLRAGERLLASRRIGVTCSGAGGDLSEDSDPDPALGMPAPTGPVPAPGLAAAPPGSPPPVVPVPAPAPAGAGAGSAAAAGATSSAAGGALGVAGSSSPVVGLAAAPQQETAPRRAEVTLTGGGHGGADPSLAAVPLAGGTLATAALTGHLLATRRRQRVSPPRRAEI